MLNDMQNTIMPRYLDYSSVCGANCVREALYSCSRGVEVE